MDVNLSNIEEWLEITVKRIIKNELRHGGYIKTWVAKVESVGTGTANVTLVGDDINVVSNLINDTGKTLNVNDKVYLFSHSSSLSDAFIGRKI